MEAKYSGLIQDILMPKVKDKIRVVWKPARLIVELSSTLVTELCFSPHLRLQVAIREFKEAHVTYCRSVQHLHCPCTS